MTFIPSDTINGLPRKLVNEVTKLLKEFYHLQPGWGNAAVEGLYAEKIIHAVRKYSAYLDTLVPTYKQDALEKIAAIKAHPVPQVRNLKSADSEVDETTKAGSMRYWTQFWLSARGRK